LVEQSVLIVATLSLVIEFVVLGLLTLGYLWKRMKNYRRHGITMTAALVLHLVTIFSWMIWSFICTFWFSDHANSVIVTLVHVVLGIGAAALGVWLVASWHMQTDVQKCFPRKRIMLTTIILWVTAIALGIVLYAAVVMS
jgi:hypothetical protein